MALKFLQNDFVMNIFGAVGPIAFGKITGGVMQGEAKGEARACTGVLR